MTGSDIFVEKKLTPMLACKHEPFNSEEYLYEIKWDGIRCLAYIDEKVELRSRNNRDITYLYPEFQGLSDNVSRRKVILDGEIVVMKNGIPSFHEWQKRSSIKDLSRLERMALTNPAVYIVFDILYMDGRNLLSVPLKERKDILDDVLKQSPVMVVSDYVRNMGIELFNAALEKGLEGVVAKKADSPYVPAKRTSYWLKFKKISEEDFVICGYIPGKHWGLGSLILGLYDNDNRLVYQGTVGTGFNRKDSEILVEFLNRFRSGYPFDVKIKEIANGIFSGPRLVCTVEFLEKGESGLRHASFKGIRSDKNPLECRIRSEDGDG